MGGVAIVGMACLFPGAPDIKAFWRNIVNKVDCISDPPENWEGLAWYDPDSKESDRIYSKRAGYLKDLSRFDPIKYGIFPKAVEGSEPEHWLSLKIAYEAIADAGVPEIPLNRERTEVIMGRGTFINRGYATLCHHSFGIDQALSILKELLPEFANDRMQELKRKLRGMLPPFGVDTAPGLVTSIMTGRIANRLDLKGSSYAIDAACSSSLLAIEHGYYDLISGRCDAALVGGVNLSTHHPMHLLFCQLGAASRSQQIRPFDEHADGTIIGEGVAMVLLKRCEDAERDGNRIYAVIRGAGSSSDGKGSSVVAPRAEGEELAIRRAYEQAGCDPHSVELVEAHGTGIPLGDATEIKALTRVFGPREGDTPQCAIGTIKSMIGHLLPAAGMAGLIKAALSLYHKTFPPSLHCSHPDPGLKLEASPFYVNTETRPWIQGATSAPRRAGINAFGFGGSNAHVILEEYTAGDESEAEDFDSHWETELLIIQGQSRDILVQEVERVITYLEADPSVLLKDLAYTLNSTLVDGTLRLAVVASSPEELKNKLAHALGRLRDASRSRIKDKSGIYYFDGPLSRGGKLAFLFPGEGSQYVNMLSDLCRHFPEVRYQFDFLGKACVTYPKLSLYRDAIFPPPALSDHERAAAEARLWEMDNAVTSVMTADKAMLVLLQQLKIVPEAMAGHSSGELFTFAASGVSELTRSREEYVMTYLLLGHQMIERIEKEPAIPEAPLLTVGGVSRNIIAEIVARSGGTLMIAMDNCPNQVVLCCKDRDAVDGYMKQLKKHGAICQVLPFSRPYHTPLFEPARKHLDKLFDLGTFSAPQVTVYSCMTTRPLPSDSGELRRFGIEQWLNPVRFQETIEAMYGDGVRIFLEVGPKAQLTGFVNDILRKKECVAIATNVQYRSGITQLHHALGLLAAHGISMDLHHLYKRRNPHRLDVGAQGAAVGKAEKREPALPLAIPLLSLKGVTPDWLCGKPSVPLKTEKREEEMPPGAAYQGVAQNRSQVMTEYFRVMEHFLDDQQSMFHAYAARDKTRNARIPDAPAVSAPLSRRNRSSASIVERREHTVAGNTAASTRPPAADVSLGTRELPFIRTILNHTPGEEAAVLCELTLEEDIFLLDHTFGREISVTDTSLSGLPVVPLTMSMEIMAEAGALLFPGKVLTGMKDIRAYRWITLEEGRFLLKIEAQREGAHEARVRLRKAVDQNGTTAVGLPILEGIVVFADQYPDPPAVGAFPLTGRRSSRLTSEDLYAELMFHGPCFRAVTSVDWWGEEGIEATMQTLPTNSLFRSQPNPRFVFDPVLLDAAGQLVAFYYNDDMSKGVDLYPFRVEALHVYSPTLPAATKVPSRCRTTHIARNQLRSDIDMIGPDGRYTMRLVGWDDREFMLPASFSRARFKAREVFLSTPWPVAVAGLEKEKVLACYRMDDYADDLLHGHNGVWLNVLVHLALSGREREQWRTMKASEHRRVDWLLARVAAKDAVRDLLKKRHGLQLCLPDIDIAADSYGKPFVTGMWTREAAAVPEISLSHKKGMGLAVACEGVAGCGIDIEIIGEKKKGINHMVLKPEEQELVGALLSSADDEWMLRLWCAKEAVGKALGRGLPTGPQDLAVRKVHISRSVVELEVAGRLAEQLPHLRGKPLAAVTRRDGALIVAAALHE